jgi:DNA-binding CsgD family transcriptional regulator
MNTFANTLERPNTQEQQLDNIFLEGVLEGWMDGVLLLTVQGEWLYANHLARQICQQLTHNQSHPNLVPGEIWRVCQALIDSRQSYPNQMVIMESEITTDESSAFRIRTRWFNLDDAKHPHILVTLEDKRQSRQSLAIAEAKQYELTRREAEVWSLRRANYSYKEIAAKLYITLNTVKKHVKNIRAKQELIMGNG